MLLMVHQATSLDLAEKPRVVLEAPTGAGKTWAGAVPLLDAADRGESAIFVYPTNALADDQQASLAALIRRAERVPGVVGSDGRVDPAGADIMLWRLHAGVLDESREHVGGRSRGQTISRILEKLPPKPLWLVTNPDTLFLLCTARYGLSPQIWSRLQGCRSLVLDEFHLYRGPTLVRALALIELAGLLLGVDRIRVLSATLPSSVLDLLQKRFSFESIRPCPASNGRIVQHEIELDSAAVSGEAATDRIVDEIASRLATLRSERASGRVPLLVLRQSVLATVILEDRLAGRGIDRAEIGIYRGLSSRAIRSIDGKTLVLGTSSLEVGVDFDTSRLIFEALTAPSFAQRLGRLGRHGAGQALFLTNARVADVLSQLGDCDRPTLLMTVAGVLAQDDDLAGFATSPWGFVVADATFRALEAKGRELVAPKEFFDRVAEVRNGFVAALGVAQARPGEVVSRKVRDRLAAASTFRGDVGSVEVYDVRERDRRGTDELARYDLDLCLFYRRACWQGAPDDGDPLISGYSKPRPLSLRLDMDPPPGFGLHAPQSEQLQLRVDGKATQWESLLREREHVVGLFPASLRGSLSWREDVFDSDDHRIALLDDDAIVAAYVFGRQQGIGG
jgi:DEAD/DEAH box helicase